MASFRFEITNKATRNKRFPIMLCITINGKRKRLKTPVEVSRRSDFNSKCKGDNWIRANVPDSKKWNYDLHNFLEEAKAQYIDLKEESMATSESVVNSLKSSEISHSFIEFANQRAQEILEAGGLRNWKKYNGFLNKLSKFLKRRRKNDLQFSEITPEFLAGFDNFLHKLKNERDSNKLLHPNTIQVVLNIFKTIMRRAVEMGYISYEKNPFLVFKYSGVKTEKEKLSISEIRAIEELNLENNSLIWHCRNCFLFSFYCAGIRAGDLLQLRWCNISSEGRITYQMGKNHKTRDLILVEQALDILKNYHSEETKYDDYIFPFLNKSKPYASAITQADIDTMPRELKNKLYSDIGAKNALINKYLKKIAKLAGIEKNITLHVSRHAFAKIAKEEGMDNGIVKNLLAHSSIRTTETYMGDFDSSSNDRALNDLFNKKRNKQEVKKQQIVDELSKRSPEELDKILKALQNN